MYYQAAVFLVLLNVYGSALPVDQQNQAAVIPNENRQDTDMTETFIPYSIDDFKLLKQIESAHILCKIHGYCNDDDADYDDGKHEEKRLSSNLFHGIPKFGKRAFSSAFAGIPKFG